MVDISVKFVRKDESGTTMSIDWPEIDNSEAEGKLTHLYQILRQEFLNKFPGELPGDKHRIDVQITLSELLED